MNGQMTTDTTSAAAIIQPMTRNQSFVYRHAVFHEPNVSSPTSGTVANRISMKPRNLRN